MNSSTALQGDLLLVTQLELIGSTSVAGMLYGVAFTLYCLYVHSSIPQLRTRERNRQTTFMLTATTVVMVLGLLDLTLNVRITLEAFIKHYDFPGGPVAYESAQLKVQFMIWDICSWLIILIMTTIQVWRLWILWNTTRYGKLVMILPLLCILASFPLAISTVLNLTFIRPGGKKQALIIGIAEFLLHAILTIYCTTLISTFITCKYRRHSRVMGTTQYSTRYKHIVAILVESYALESVWAIITVVLWASSNPVYQFFANTETYIEIIASVLVLYRVARGQAHESQQQKNNPILSPLRWNSPSA